MGSGHNKASSLLTFVFKYKLFFCFVLFLLMCDKNKNYMRKVP